MFYFKHTCFVHYVLLAKEREKKRELAATDAYVSRSLYYAYVRYERRKLKFIQKIYTGLKNKFKMSCQGYRLHTAYIGLLLQALYIFTSPSI